MKTRIGVSFLTIAAVSLASCGGGGGGGDSSADAYGFLSLSPATMRQHSPATTIHSNL